MPSDKLKGIKTGAKEAAIEIVKQVIPFSGALIESVRQYHESIENQQREEFVAALAEQMDELKKNVEWYNSQPGQAFVKKVVATALNAEYADKLDFLVNAMVNGPKLGNDDAARNKFVDLIRQLSRSAMEVLVTSIRSHAGTGQVMPGTLAQQIGWDPHLVEACVKELHSNGVYSSTTQWRRTGETYTAQEFFDEGIPAITDFTRAFSSFIRASVKATSQPSRD